MRLLYRVQYNEFPFGPQDSDPIPGFQRQAAHCDILVCRDLTADAVYLKRELRIDNPAEQRACAAAVGFCHALRVSIEDFKEHLNIVFQSITPHGRM